MDDIKKEFPEGMEPLGNSMFQFRCEPDVECYMQCCRKLDLILYPYDIIRLKNRLGISSDQLLDQHVDVVLRPSNFFPEVLLRMSENREKTCPFLIESGCSVYPDRPDTCRTFPVEQGAFFNANNRKAELRLKAFKKQLLPTPFSS